MVLVKSLVFDIAAVAFGEFLNFCCFCLGIFGPLYCLVFQFVKTKKPFCGQILLHEVVSLQFHLV